MPISSKGGTYPAVKGIRKVVGQMITELLDDRMTW